jgi:hypothetical protein
VECSTGCWRKAKGIREAINNSFKNNGLSGNREVPVPFEEADGLWLSIQGKSFKDKIAALMSDKVSERLTERFEEMLSSSKAGLNKTVRKAVYPLHRGQEA